MLKQKWQSYTAAEKAACIVMLAAGLAAVLLCIPAMRGQGSALTDALLLGNLALMLAADGLLRWKRKKAAAIVAWCVAVIFCFAAVSGMLPRNG